MNQRSLALAAVLVSTASLHAAEPATCSNQQTPQQIEARINALINAMTPAERIAQLQDRAPAIPRLGLPAYNWWNEGLHGIARNGYATVFPQAIGLAATWDASLLHQIGATVSTEARAKFNQHRTTDSPRYGGLTIWSPNINIFRDPRWGRGQETYGEDPFLTGLLAKQFVQGIQGNDPFYAKADGTAKHFAVHSGPEEGRDSFNATPSQHDLADTYLKAFHELSSRDGANAIMCSYNGINGVPACANTSLLQHTMRDTWGFRGYLVSDCDAVGNIHSYQHYAPDAEHGAAAALHAGVDLNCGSAYKALNGALSQGLVQQQEIDQSLRRLLLARIKLGLLDASGCTPYDKLSLSDVNTPASRQLAYRAAVESMVLLHNNGVLPLDPQRTRVAVIGPNAAALNVLEGNYHGTAKAPVLPLDGIRQTFRHVTYAQGSTLADGVPTPIPSNALRTSLEPNAPAGLNAAYFAEASLTGKPALETQVQQVDFDLDRVGPHPAITSKRFAARWHGYLIPPAAGDYTLRIQVERCWDCTTHDFFRLVLDGKEVVANDGSHENPAEYTLHVTEANKPVSISLELLHSGEDEGITLSWIPPAAPMLQQAKAVAQDSDVVVAFLGLSPLLEGEALKVSLEGFAGGDRTSLALPKAQLDLLAALKQTGKPVVVVLMSGSAIALPPDGLAALLEAWYPGEAAGSAIADVLSGKQNPSGRLPVTFYRSASDLPAFQDYSMKGRTYRYFDKPTLYRFGDGLSYSRFAYSQVKADIDAANSIQASAIVRNTSKRAGDEVVQLYITPPNAEGAPRLTLQGTQRVHLQPGEARTVRFHLSTQQLQHADANGSPVKLSGDYRIFIGSGQPGDKTPGGTATLRLN